VTSLEYTAASSRISKGYIVDSKATLSTPRLEVQEASSNYNISRRA
jgi:hypothetical protein